MEQNQLDERKEQLDQLFSFGVEYLEKIKNDIRKQDEKISNLQSEITNYKNFRSDLEQVLKKFGKDGE